MKSSLSSPPRASPSGGIGDSGVGLTHLKRYSQGTRIEGNFAIGVCCRAVRQPLIEYAHANVFARQIPYHCWTSIYLHGMLTTDFQEVPLLEEIGQLGGFGGL